MVYWIVYYLSICSPLLPVLMVHARKKNTLLWFYALAGFSFDLVSFLIRYYDGRNNRTTNLSLAENLFMIFEFLLISLYYRGKVFRQSRLYPFVILTLILLYALCNWSHYNVMFNFVGGTLFDFACIVFAIMGFHTLLKKRKVVFLDKSSFFWINVAVLIYCTGNFLIFLFAGYLQEKDKAFLTNLWIFHNVLNIIFSVLIAISFLKRNTEE